LKPSDIQSILSSNHFVLDKTSAVWRHETLTEFPYSDGDEAENYVLEALKSSPDVSIHSADLALKMKDWPSIYHLSPRRANLLRPFGDWFKDKRILEIGCGCGAISRFLGESGAQVVSVEGSFRRAGIARERCRDLTNVEVICSPSDQIPDLGKFDAVMLIGVLEYARVFLGSDGQQLLLKACQSRLELHGRLFVAIENKLGIKYFAGANEDHVNLPMYGINNSYNEQGVVTYGRLELRGVLADAGFNYSENYLPLPDYKLPVSVITPDGWQNHAHDLAQLALESAHKDQQAIAENTFSLEQGILNIWNNGLGADLANSFLVVATQQPLPSLTSGIAAFHYSDSRLPKYRKSSIFVINPDGHLSVQAKSDVHGDTSIVTPHHVTVEDHFYQGKTLWLDLVHIVNRPDWRLSEVGDWARGWINHLLLRAGLPICYDRNVFLPDGYQDALPFNIIRQKNGELTFFDQEWESQEAISVEYIGFRGILHSLLRLSSVSYTQYYDQTKLAAIALDVLQNIGFLVNKDDLTIFLSHEARFLALIQQTDERELYNSLKDLKMIVRAPSVEFLRIKANELWVKNLALLNRNIVKGKGLEQLKMELDVMESKEASLNRQIANITASEAKENELVMFQQKQLLEQEQLVQQQEQLLHQQKRLMQRQEQLIQQKEQQLQDNFSSINSYQKQLTQLEQQITNYESHIALQDKKVDEILNSSSWRISAPIRLIGRKTPVIIRRTCRSVIRKLFIGGRAFKSKINRSRHGDRVTVTAPSSNSLKYRARRIARYAYSLAPERYKGHLLKFAMRVRPGWFLHHPSYRPVVPASDIPLMSSEIASPARQSYINRATDGHYHYADSPDEYTYIATEKPYYFDEIVDKFSIHPTFSIIVPIYNTPLDLLEKMVSSVRNQWYPDWELVLVNDASPLAETALALDALNDSRIKVIHLIANQGIAGATNAAIENATNDYIVFLDHDDELTDDCLFELAKCIDSEDPDFIYSDEDKFTPENTFSQPHFKPDWSPDTMMGTMFTCHVACVKLSVAKSLGGLRGEFNGCQDWDFILRLTETTNKISHIPKVLYHWRIIPASVASDMAAKPYVLAASRAVRENALKRRGLKGTVEELPNYTGYFRVNYALQGNPLISIIIPTRDNHAVLQRCIESIFAKTHYRNIELVIIDNGSKEISTLDYFEQLKSQSRVKVVRHDQPFNFSQLNNVGVEHSNGEILLFLNDDTEVLQDDWLERMGGYAQLKHIGAVGAKLLYGDCATMQHMGILSLQNGPIHAYIRQHKDQPGYFLRNQIEYNWLAVTGACLMIERKKFLSLGGFDETFPIAYNDVDLCMRLVDAGLYNVMCQAVTLIHHESLSRGLDHMSSEKLDRLKREMARLYDIHPIYFQYDPFFNINFKPNGYNFEI
jgi:glycosyltransferase involved in cell wall biosynthesis/2-polyprenyl-3-methyl-5-hydroxy-6-metoxy-1,4-benzoquinol methylase